LDTFPNRFRNTTRHDLRIIGVDDGAFPSHKRATDRALLVAVLFESSRILDVQVGQIQVDGRDANNALSSLLSPLSFHVILLSGISFGGFNLVDISQLARSMRRPVIAISGEEPDNASVRKALHAHFADWKERWDIVRATGELHSTKPLPDEPKLYFEVRGASPEFAKRVIASTAAISRLPEPIRVARILARGLSELKQPKILGS
jgi:endonuclease V-like protein UPF0215 family